MKSSLRTGIPEKFSNHKKIAGEAELRILILEDNPADAEIMEYHLREAGLAFSAKVVETGAAFRKELAASPPGIILSDYNLPDIDGAQALKAARQMRPDVPFILVTGAIGEERAIDVLTSGATDYVLKDRITRLAPAVTRALQEVRERREREKAQLMFKTLVEQLPAVTYIIAPDRQGDSGNDPDYSYVYVSPQSEAMTGIAPAAFLADPGLFTGLIHPADRTRIAEQAARSRSRQEPFRAEYRIFHSDGRLLWLRDEAIPVKSGPGGPPWIQGILTDITAMKEAEEELRRAHDTLESRVRERTEELEAFTSSVSHDLRGPVWTLDRYIQMLIEDYGGRIDPDLDNRIRSIWKTVRNMNQLIDDLLSLTRVNRAEINISRIDLREIVLDAWEEVRGLNPGKDVALTIKDLPAAMGDRNLIRQVVYNLLSNAVKFSAKRRRPAIELGGHKDGDNCIFYVRDNGVGFDMKQHDRMFGTFERLHGSQFEGTGVGLAIVRRIMLRHGGCVRAEGAVNKGATFFFSLPS